MERFIRLLGLNQIYQEKKIRKEQLKLKKLRFKSSRIMNGIIKGQKIEK